MLKDLVHSGFPHVWVTQARQQEGTGGADFFLSSVMFFSVCAAFPVAIFRKMSTAEKTPQNNKCPPLTETAAHEFSMFFFLTLVSPTAARTLQSSVFYTWPVYRLVCPR